MWCEILATVHVGIWTAVHAPYDLEDWATRGGHASVAVWLASVLVVLHTVRLLSV